MKYKSIAEFTKSLKKILTSKGFDIADEDDYVLTYEVERAIAEINNCRNFDATEEKPYDKKYEHMIIPLSVSAFAKSGAEGQNSHSENGIVRNYTSGGDYPKEELAKIIPLIR